MGYRGGINVCLSLPSDLAVAGQRGGDECRAARPSSPHGVADDWGWNVRDETGKSVWSHRGSTRWAGVVPSTAFASAIRPGPVVVADVNGVRRGGTHRELRRRRKAAAHPPPTPTGDRGSCSRRCRVSAGERGALAVGVDGSAGVIRRHRPTASQDDERCASSERGQRHQRHRATNIVTGLRQGGDRRLR